MNDVKVFFLTSHYERSYINFLNATSGALLFHSLEYRNLLIDALGKSSQDKYIIATIDEKVVGALPLFCNTRSAPNGIINSLPFYGSHGGLLIRDGFDVDFIGRKILNYALDYFYSGDFLSFNIVDNPFDSRAELFEEVLQKKKSDYRVSQYTRLPVKERDRISIERALMDQFHSKTRNMVRKAAREGFICQVGNMEAFGKGIYDLHVANMEKISGKAKPPHFFKAVSNHFSVNRDYRVYLALKNGEMAAGLLLFYYKDFCEYFTPVISEKYRNRQPLSFLIMNAMCDCVERGIKIWNWGGTWPSSQEGVYLFKKRWGAEELEYNYYTITKDSQLLHDSLSTLVEENKYYYIAKF